MIYPAHIIEAYRTLIKKAEAHVTARLLSQGK